ncbi:MAG: aldo/keto reductase [Synechococcaceae cyanobacterium]|nr:aldo/keto reductase [Synechococcaceae cyanobacterium]
MRSAAFANGDRMPLLGLGTWKSSPGQVYGAVREAIRLGYRHIDCASVYANEPEIGAALRDALLDGEVSREELWITSKLWCNSHGRENVEPALRRTLEDLGLEWLDLYLIHWPVPIKPGVAFPQSAADLLPPEALPLQATWEGMEAAMAAGLTRHIGVSNFSVRKLQDLLAHSRQKPEVNQVELHPLLQQPALLAFCAEQGIHVTAYSPLGSRDRPAAIQKSDDPVLLENAVIGSIAAEHGCSPAQVLLAWHVQRGTSTIPKSVTPARLRENLAAADLSLSPSDLERISRLDQGLRLVDGTFWLLEGGPWSLDRLWDGD